MSYSQQSSDFNREQNTQSYQNKKKRKYMQLELIDSAMNSTKENKQIIIDPTYDKDVNQFGTWREKYTMASPVLQCNNNVLNSAPISPKIMNQEDSIFNDEQITLFMRKGKCKKKHGYTKSVIGRKNDLNYFQLQLEQEVAKQKIKNSKSLKYKNYIKDWRQGKSIDTQWQLQYQQEIIKSQLFPQTCTNNNRLAQQAQQFISISQGNNQNDFQKQQLMQEEFNRLHKSKSNRFYRSITPYYKKAILIATVKNIQQQQQTKQNPKDFSLPTINGAYSDNCSNTPLVVRGLCYNVEQQLPTVSNNNGKHLTFLR